MLGTLTIIVAIIFLLYRYLTSDFDYWTKLGVKGPKPIIFFGTIKDVILLKISLTEYMTKLYHEYKNEPFIGVYFRNIPVLLLKDPQLIKDILIKDFSYFSQRGLHILEKTEPLSQNLLFLETKRWRLLRKRFVPAFSANKVREMFPLMLQCVDDVENYLNTIPDNDIIEFREIAARFTTDVIGKCAFGIEINSLSDEKSEFRKMGREFFRTYLRKTIGFRIRESYPKFYNSFPSLFYDNGVTKFFMDTFTQLMDYRKKNNIIRHDILNMLMEVKDNPDKLGEDIELTDSFLVAQAFVFFAAGFETSSSTISNALYELAQHQDVQDKLRTEIREEYKKNNGTLTYETIKTMPYLDAVFQEILRMYPSGLLLIRQCVAPYTFGGTKVTIPKGQDILVPLIPIQRDPEVFPNPDIFDPERFMDKATFDEQYYMPFGRGPRNCIGERFAVYETKIGIIAFLRNHKVDVCEKTEIPSTIDPCSILLAPKGGIYLKISKVSEG